MSRKLALWRVIARVKVAVTQANDTSGIVEIFEPAIGVDRTFNNVLKSHVDLTRLCRQPLAAGTAKPIKFFENAIPGVLP